MPTLRWVHGRCKIRDSKHARHRGTTGLTLNDDIELVRDRDGLAIIGSPTAVEQFVTSTGLTPVGRSRSLGQGLRLASGLAGAGGEVTAESGRWLRLTAESKAKLDQFGLMDTDTPGIRHVMLGQRGNIKGWLQVESGPTSLAANPAVLSGAAGIMAQLAMQQAVNEVVDYLEVLDAKLDDVLRAQTNEILSRLDGVALAVQEAMSVRDQVGHVSDVTWSKIQGSASRIHETQGYALRQLSDLADKLEGLAKVSDLADIMASAETDVRSWLLVLARCIELHDQIAVLELDRVLTSSPDEIDRHRIGLQSARDQRIQTIADQTDQLLERMAAAARLADDKVLFNPFESPIVVRTTNVASGDVHDFRETLGIESAHEPAPGRPWTLAASEAWEVVRETGTEAASAVRSAGSGAYGSARERINDARGSRTGDRDAIWLEDDSKPSED